MNYLNWRFDIKYVSGDTVSHNGKLYKCVKACRACIPLPYSDYWERVG